MTLSPASRAASSRSAANYPRVRLGGLFRGHCNLNHEGITCAESN